MKNNHLTVGIVSVCILFAVQGKSVAQADYVSHRVCKLCHNKTAYGTQWDIWKASPHARAFETLLGPRSREIAREKRIEVAPSEAPECLRCHATAYDSATGTVPDVLSIMHGVQCESCHGAGAQHLPDGRKHWLGRDVSVDFTVHILRPNERTCAQCHRRQSPTWDPNRYALPDGRTTGFDFQQALEKITHPLKRHFAEDFGAKSEGSKRKKARRRSKGK